MKDKVKKCLIAGYDLDIITQEEMDILWNYITNLQEENEHLKFQIECLSSKDKPKDKMIEALALENEKLKNELYNVKASYETEAEAKYYEYIDKYEIKLQDRINKAIDYINDMCLFDDGYANYGDDLRPAHIVNILKGEYNE